MSDIKELEKRIPITEWFEIERRMAIMARMTTTETFYKDRST